MQRRDKAAAKFAVDNGPRFGEEVHRLRRQREMTIEGLAEATGLSRSVISDAERDRYVPSGRTVDVLVEHLAPEGQADALAALAAETYRRIEIDLDGLDRERIEVLVQFRRRLASLSQGDVGKLRSFLADAN